MILQTHENMRKTTVFDDGLQYVRADNFQDHFANIFFICERSFIYVNFETFSCYHRRIQFASTQVVSLHEIQIEITQSTHLHSR
jgi:hypothetical protein